MEGFIVLSIKSGAERAMKQHEYKTKMYHRKVAA